MIPKLSPQLEGFIRKYITSFVKWDLVVFFCKNPGVANTATALANRLGRKPSDVSRALEDLAQDGLLAREAADTDSEYRFSTPEHLSSMVHEFVAALETREKRLQILTAFLRKGAR